MNHPPPDIITIDGPASSGKSTVAKRCAQKISYAWISTGKLYRLCGVLARKRQIITSTHTLAKDAEYTLSALATELQQKVRFAYKNNTHILTLNGKDVSSQILSEEAGSYAALLGKNHSFRKALLPWQQHLARFTSPRGVIFDGRDMGTVVFKDLATVKFYLTASPHIRAQRRWQDLHPHRKPSPAEIKHLTTQLQNRDTLDYQRDIAPLKPAQDALICDTSHMTQQEVIDWVSERIPKRPISSLYG
ncbi:MAG: (d)CMP kinase [Proteobacteria bacterium]|nr:(d)CMP kinase [Pseudomonadota bacterium]